MLDFEVFWKFLIRDLFANKESDLTKPVVNIPPVPKRKCTVRIDKKECARVYHSLPGPQPGNTLELCHPTIYEVPISFDYPRHKLYNQDALSQPVGDGITVSLSPLSFQCCLFLLRKLATENNNNVPTNFASRLRYSYAYNSNEAGEIDFDVFIPQIFQQAMLKITAKQALTLQAFRSYAYFFSFHFIYHTKRSFVECSNLRDIFDLEGRPYTSSAIPVLPLPALCNYNQDAVDFYKLAMSAADPYHQFLAYYHVIEYYFDQVSLQALNQGTREKPKADALPQVRCSERASLKAVLQTFVEEHQLNTRLAELDSTAAGYVETEKVAFSGAPTIAWKNTRSFHTTLANRIYNTRNALVHSKSGKKHQMYKPASHSAELKREIPLIRAVAEAVIIGSSQLMD